jgi:hypothetical protein
MTVNPPQRQRIVQPVARPSPLPNEGGQQWRVLMGLLDGDKITPISAIIDYNCFAINARASELRKLGWPIRVIDMPHPNQEKFPGAMLPCYFMDAHFREWAISQRGKNPHPLDYPGQDGRGKFAKDA